MGKGERKYEIGRGGRRPDRSTAVCEDPEVCDNLSVARTEENANMQRWQDHRGAKSTMMVLQI